MATVDNYREHSATTSSPFVYATKLHRRIHSDSQALLNIVKGHAKAVMAAASTLTSSHSSAKLASGVSAAAVEGYERREADQCVWYTIRVYPCPITVRGSASMPIPRKSYSVYRRYEDVVEFAERIEAERPFFKAKHNAAFIVRRLVHQSTKSKSNAVRPPWSPVNAFGTEADCIRRKRNLDIYLQELFKLGPAIGQCRLAAEFFGMWKTDLEANLRPALHSLAAKPCLSERNEQLPHSQASLGLPMPFKTPSNSSFSLNSFNSVTQLSSTTSTSTSDTTPPRVPLVSGVKCIKVCETLSRTSSLAQSLTAQNIACLPSPPGSSYHSDDEGEDYDEDMDDTEGHGNVMNEDRFSREHMNSPCPSIDGKDDILNSASTDLKSLTSLQPLWQVSEPEMSNQQISKRHNAVQYERLKGSAGPTSFPLPPLSANALHVGPSCDVERSPCLVSKIHRESIASLRPPIHASVSKKIASFQSRCPTPLAASLSEPGQTIISALRGASSPSKINADSAQLSHVCTGQKPNASASRHPSSMPERIKSQNKHRAVTRSIKRRKRVSGPRPSLSPTVSKPSPGILKNWTRTVKETRLTCQTSPVPPCPRGGKPETSNIHSRMTSPTPGAQFLSKYPKAFVAIFKIVVDPERIVALQVTEKDEDFMLSVPDLRLRVSQKFERVEMPLPNEFELVWEPCSGSKVVLKNDEELQRAIHSSTTQKITLRCTF